MRLVICWTDISGYMAACWRALRPLVDHLHVIAYAVGSGEQHIEFQSQLMCGIPHDLLPRGPNTPPADVAEFIRVHQPDVIVLPGWAVPAYTPIPFHPAFGAAKFIMTMDTPFSDSLRQKFGRWRFGRYLKRMSRVAVPGERAAYLARRLGFSEAQILIGLYGIDYDALAPARERRIGRGEWPRRFLYTGRYCDMKAIDVLVSGYQKYRDGVADPWPLTCCGSGPDKSLLAGQAGVEDRGFVQPHLLYEVFAESGAFVLASSFDPWPLVIVEAAAAGLPVVHSSACGSAVECVRAFHSGLSFPAGDADALAHRLKWIHEHHHELPQMGEHAQQLAKPFAAQTWARRWAQMLTEL